MIGWETGSRQTTPLIISALQMATSRLKKEDSVILHSDQGSQYSSYDYKKLAKKYNITLSMSRRGNCYDNAVAESFFKTLKKELVRKQIFHTRAVAASKIFCSTIQKDDTVIWIIYHQMSLKKGIIWSL